MNKPDEHFYSREFGEQLRSRMTSINGDSFNQKAKGENNNKQGVLDEYEKQENVGYVKTTDSKKGDRR